MTGAMLKPGAVVVDVGINVVDGRIVGDVDFASAVEVASAITPVPGGVGPLTNAILLTHLIRAAERQVPAGARGRPTPRIAVTTRAVRRRPMSFPSDLEIARSVAAAPDRRGRGRAGHPGRRAGALRSDQGQGRRWRRSRGWRRSVRAAATSW